METRVQDVEALEAITQGEVVREVVLPMAGLGRGGKLPLFTAVGSDLELDADTKATVLQLARDETFLAAGDCLRAISYLHQGGR